MDRWLSLLGVGVAFIVFLALTALAQRDDKRTGLGGLLRLLSVASALVVGAQLRWYLTAL